MDYCLNSERETLKMLGEIGAGSMEDLFSYIPSDLRTKNFNIPEGISEFEALRLIKELAQANNNGLLCFLGGGAYDHFIPAAVDFLSERSEFYTAYTPYQPECSQGTLQALFEYQTSICRITGMDAANASVYDGATALAEAALMAVRATQRSGITVCGSVSPFYKRVLKTYLSNHPVELCELAPSKRGPDIQEIKSHLNGDTAALIVQNPGFLGSAADYSEIALIAHESGAKLIMSVYPASLGILKKPSEMGADIAVGEGQSLGLPLSFGGPYFGFITARMNLMRNLPGRIAGETLDRNGKRCYVLTLQAREQHIRRQKATSNICSNQSLCVLRAVIYLSLLGETGFKKLADLNYNKSEYLKKLVKGIKNASVWNESPTFNEFTLELGMNSEEAARRMRDRGILAGIPLGGLYPGMDNMLLVAVTEKRSRKEIENYASVLEDIL